jgi:hypothetical protein
VALVGHIVNMPLGMNGPRGEGAGSNETTEAPG